MALFAFLRHFLAFGASFKCLVPLILKVSSVLTSYLKFLGHTCSNEASILSKQRTVTVLRAGDTENYKNGHILLLLLLLEICVKKSFQARTM